jgi:hypothetical protein
MDSLIFKQFRKEYFTEEEKVKGTEDFFRVEIANSTKWKYNTTV